MGNLGGWVTDPKVQNPEDENVWEETPRKIAIVELLNRYLDLVNNASKK